MRRITVYDFPDERIELRVTQVLHQVYADGFELHPRHVPDPDVHYIAEGRVRFESDEGSWESGPGDVVFGSRGQRMGFRSMGRLALYHCHFSFHGVRPIVLASSQREWAHIMSCAGHSAMRLERSLYLPDRMPIIQRDKVAELFAAMVRDQDSGQPAWRLAVKAQFLLLLRAVSHEVFQNLLDRSPTLSLSKAHLHVTRTLRLIELNLAQSISVHTLAKDLSLSRDYLGRAFKQYMGESVGSYILHRRLSVAKDLLISSVMNVKEIARTVGFRDALYFSRVFRREEGMSPTEFVAEHSALSAVHARREEQTQPG